MAKAVFTPAPEVEAIANDLIPKYHHYLAEFNVRIEYVFIDKTPKSKGKEIWGTCRRVSNLNAFLANEKQNSDSFFVITISKPVWDVLPLDKQTALVDHELCHAYAELNPKEDEEPVKTSINPHDLEEFTCIVRRYGLWRADIEAFVSAAKEESEDQA